MEANFDRTAAEQAFQESLDRLKSELLSASMNDETLASSLQPEAIEVSETIEPESESWEAAIQDIEQFFNGNLPFS